MAFELPELPYAKDALTGVSAEVEPGGRLRFVVSEGRIAEVLLDG